MTGEFLHTDERFVHEGSTYHYMLAKPGSQGSVSSSPFAPKSTTGDRSYADYDAISALAFTDFSGGIGQERMTDPTKFYSEVDTDTRGGPLTLGPRVTTTTDTFLQHTPNPNYYVKIGYHDYDNGAGSERHKYAQRFNTPTDMTQIRSVWLFLRCDQGTELGNIAVKLYANELGYPGAVLASTNIYPGQIRAAGWWVQAKFTTPQTVTPNATYWIGVENANASTYATKYVYWLSGDWTGGDYEVVFDRLDSWEEAALARMVFLVDDYNVRPDSPVTPFIGVGGDSITRVWARADRSLYYMDNSSSPTPVEDGGTPSAVKLLGADIVGHAWYRALSDTTNYLYLALGDATPIERYNGMVGTNASKPVWTTQTGQYAHALAVHDNLLFFAYDRNKVDAFDGTLWGSAGGAGYAPVGDRAYQVRNMVSWNGFLWAGKDDGLYKITNYVGYPAAGDPLECTKVLDLLSVADDTNFSLMVVHQGDLYFNVANGLMRYTTGNVLQSIAPDTALNVSDAKRFIYRAGVSALNTLFVLAQSSVAHDTATQAAEVGSSCLMSYNDGHWHALATITDVENLVNRGICLEPGWYGENARLWYGTGMLVNYIDMPMDTHRRWLVPHMAFAPTGYLLTSWIDGNIRTIEKDWMSVELVTYDAGGTDANSVFIYWRPDEDTAWEFVGGAESNSGAVELDFPTGSHSTKCQLKVEINNPEGLSYTAGNTTPRVEAVVVKYMERPDDIRSFTRSYKLATRQENRNGVLVTRSLAEQLADLRTLRQAKEPLTWYAWYGTTYTVHVVDYTVTEMPDEQRAPGDNGVMLAVVRLQEVS